MKRETKKPRPPEQYDEEYRALQASLEDYLRQHLKLLGEAGRTDVGAVREGWFRRYRADVYFVVTLLLVGFLGWRVLAPGGTAQDDRPATAADSEQAAAEPVPASPPPPRAEAAKTPPPPAPPPASKPPDGFDDPAAWWDGFVAANRARLAEWLTAVSEARGLAADEVSEMQKGNFGRWAGKVRSGTEIDQERTYCRIGLFEYAFGRWTKLEEEAAETWGRVDLVVNADEYPQEKVRALLEDLAMDHWFDDVDAEDPRTQSAVVLGWLETRQP